MAQTAQTAKTRRRSRLAKAAAPNPLPYQASPLRGEVPAAVRLRPRRLLPLLRRRPVHGPGGDYVRSACDNTRCAYVYALYFEKDQGPVAGHTHDWEAGVGGQRRGQERPSYMAASAHGQYDIKRFSDVPTTVRQPQAAGM